jgi:hypothetical protein
MIVLLWLAIPILLQYIAPATNYGFLSTPFVKGGIGVSVVQGNVIAIGSPGPIATPAQTLPLFAAWNPLIALNDTSALPFFGSPVISYTPNGVQQVAPSYGIAGLTLTLQVAYASLSSIAIVLFFALSVFFAKPNPIGRLRAKMKREKIASMAYQETPASMTT